MDRDWWALGLFVIFLVIAIWNVWSDKRRK